MIRRKAEITWFGMNGEGFFHLCRDGIIKTVCRSDDYVNLLLVAASHGFFKTNSLRRNPNEKNVMFNVDFRRKSSIPYEEAVLRIMAFGKDTRKWTDTISN